MKVSWTTIVTLIVSSILVPLFSQWKLDLTPAQTGWITATLIGLPTLIAHVWDAHAVSVKAASKIAAFIPLLVLLPWFGGCAALAPYINSQAAQQIVGTLVGTATTLILARNPADAAAVEAAANAIAGLTATNTNVAAFEQEADALLAKQHLDPRVVGELQSVVGLVALGLTIGKSALPPNTTFAVNLIFTDIAQAASSFTGVAPQARKMGLLL